MEGSSLWGSRIRSGRSKSPVPDTRSSPPGLHGSEDLNHPLIVTAPTQSPSGCPDCWTAEQLALSAPSAVLVPAAAAFKASQPPS